MSNTEHPIHFKRLQLEESAGFDRNTLDYIHRASSTGLYEIRGLGAKRKLPHFDDLVFLTASLSRYPLEGYREKCSTRTVLGTRFAKKPVVLDTPITIAAMSFGALSANVKEALGKAATAMGTTTTTGDGGMTSEERQSSKTLVYQCLPSRYGFNPDDVRRAEAGDQLGGRAERDRAAVVDDHHAVAELRRLFHVVRGQHDGAAVLVAVRADHVPQRASRLGIESRRRLVEEEQLGSPGERGRHREALPLSARKVRVAGVGLLLELHERDQLHDRPTRLVEPGEQRAELGDGLLLEQPRVLERHADTRADLLRVAPPVQPQHLDDAFGRVEQAFADLHGGRLARTKTVYDCEGIRGIWPVLRWIGQAISCCNSGNEITAKRWMNEVEIVSAQNGGNLGIALRPMPKSVRQPSMQVRYLDKYRHGSIEFCRQ